MVLVVFAAHAPFLLGQLPFSTGDDELAQMIAGTSLLERTLAQGDAWSWSYGLGGDVFSEFTYYYSTSPFFYLQMVVKALLSTVGGDVVSVIAWKLAFSIVKMALVMFAMYALLRFERQSRALSVLGAVLYGASPWYVYYELTFSFMTDAMFWLPCVALAFRNYQRGGSWVLLSAAIALTVANNFYFGFESCLFYITLFLAGSYRVCCTRREYLKAAGKALAITAVGLLLAAVAFLPSVGALVAADRSPVDVAYRVFLPFQEALAVPSRLLFVGVKALVPSFCLLAVCLSWKALDTLNRQRTMLAVFWLSALFVPLVGNVMNGMSVGFDRWHYIVAFAVAYAAPGWAASLRAQGRGGHSPGGGGPGHPPSVLWPGDTGGAGVLVVRQVGGGRRAFPAGFAGARGAARRCVVHGSEDAGRDEGLAKGRRIGLACRAFRIRCDDVRGRGHPAFSCGGASDERRLSFQLAVRCGRPLRCRFGAAQRGRRVLPHRQRADQCESESGRQRVVAHGGAHDEHLQFLGEPDAARMGEARLRHRIVLGHSQHVSGIRRKVFSRDRVGRPIQDQR